MRLDLFLKASRLIARRSLAQKFCDAGLVKVNDLTAKSSREIKVGDEIEIEGIAEKVGGSLAFTKVNIYKIVDGKRGNIVVAATHTKFVAGTAPA